MQEAASTAMRSTRAGGFWAASGGLLIAIAAGVVAPQSALAKIKCDGAYQVVSGNLLATPYCQDNNLARVARSYGLRVSDRDIRQNPNRKRYVCGIVGRDIRVRTACDSVSPYGRGNRF